MVAKTQLLNDFSSYIASNIEVYRNFCSKLNCKVAIKLS